MLVLETHKRQELSVQLLLFQQVSAHMLRQVSHKLQEEELRLLPQQEQIRMLVQVVRTQELVQLLLELGPRTQELGQLLLELAPQRLPNHTTKLVVRIQEQERLWS